MPRATKIACSRCGALIDPGQGGECENCRKRRHRDYNLGRDVDDKKLVKELYGTRRWKKVRKIVLQRDMGWCVMCSTLFSFVTHLSHIPFLLVT